MNKLSFKLSLSHNPTKFTSGGTTGIFDQVVENGIYLCIFQRNDFGSSGDGYRWDYDGHIRLNYER